MARKKDKSFRSLIFDTYFPTFSLSFFSTMDRKMMCISICVMICLGAALYVTAQALISRAGAHPSDKKDRDTDMLRAAKWCEQLAYLMGAVALLLILCCLCCRDVEFGGRHAKDDYD